MPGTLRYTPGHASHHVSYFSADAGIAFVGDTAGVQVVAGGFVLPPTPPPDIDIPAWTHSIDAIEQWRPETLFLTHFGPSGQVTSHLAELRDHLQLMERMAREVIAGTTDEAGREAQFIERLRREIGRRAAQDDVRTYEMAGRFDLNWRGIARYVLKGGKAVRAVSGLVRSVGSLDPTAGAGLKTRRHVWPERGGLRP